MRLPVQFVSKRIGRGSRIRLTLRHMTNITMQRNDNSGLPIGSGTRADGCVAEIRLHHEAGWPSHLELPLSRPR